MGEDLCNICWVEELRQAPCVVLDCGHVFHLHCIRSKLATRWVGVRVTFRCVSV
jgi:E3 ubiquitin-protein ligase MYCBP2